MMMMTIMMMYFYSEVEEIVGVYLQGLGLKRKILVLFAELI